MKEKQIQEVNAQLAHYSKWNQGEIEINSISCHGSSVVVLFSRTVNFGTESNPRERWNEYHLVGVFKIGAPVGSMNVHLV
jgi:hypothetical protein